MPVSRHGARHRLSGAAPRSGGRGRPSEAPRSPTWLVREGEMVSGQPGTGTADGAAGARASGGHGPRGRSRCARRPPASSPRSGPLSARRLRHRPGRCSASARRVNNEIEMDAKCRGPPPEAQSGRDGGGISRDKQRPDLGGRVRLISARRSTAPRSSACPDCDHGQPLAQARHVRPAPTSTQA